MMDFTQSRRGKVMLAVGYLLLGLLFLFWPGASVRVLSRVAGICLLVYGLLRLFFGWRLRRRDLDGYRSQFFLGLTFAALGVFCLANPEAVASFLPFLLGLIRLLDAVGKVQRAFELRRLGFPRWWAVLIAALVLLVVGAALLFNPFGAVKAAMVFFGVCLLADGAADLAFALLFR